MITAVNRYARNFTKAFVIHADKSCNTSEDLILRLLVILFILNVSCGKDETADPCISQVTYSTCSTNEEVADNAYIQEIRDTNNICDLKNWEEEEGFLRCSFNEESGSYDFEEE